MAQLHCLGPDLTLRQQQPLAHRQQARLQQAVTLIWDCRGWHAHAETRGPLLPLLALASGLLLLLLLLQAMWLRLRG